MVHKESYVTPMLSKEPFVCPSCCLAKHCQLVKSLVETVESLNTEILQLKSSKLPPKLDVPVSVEEPNQETKSVSSKVPSQVSRAVWPGGLTNGTYSWRKVCSLEW